MGIWAFAVDDYFVDVYKSRRDYTGPKLFVERLAAFMPLDCGATLAPLNSVERSLADVWARSAPPWNRAFGAGCTTPPASSPRAIYRR